MKAHFWCNYLPARPSSDEQKGGDQRGRGEARSWRWKEKGGKDVKTMGSHVSVSGSGGRGKNEESRLRMSARKRGRKVSPLPSLRPLLREKNDREAPRCVLARYWGRKTTLRTYRFVTTGGGKRGNHCHSQIGDDVSRKERKKKKKERIRFRSTGEQKRKGARRREVRKEGGQIMALASPKEAPPREGLFEQKGRRKKIDNLLATVPVPRGGKKEKKTGAFLATGRKEERKG